MGVTVSGVFLLLFWRLLVGELLFGCEWLLLFGNICLLLCVVIGACVCW